MRFLFQRCWHCQKRTLRNHTLCLECSTGLLAKCEWKIQIFKDDQQCLKTISILNYQNEIAKNLTIKLKESASGLNFLPIINDLGFLIREKVLQTGIIECLVPIPSSTHRLHSIHLSQCLEEQLGATVLNVLKTEKGEPQKKLKRNERVGKKMWSDVKFSSLNGVLLVDDMVSTGATGLAALRALGVREGTLLSLAYQPKLLDS